MKEHFFKIRGVIVVDDTQTEDDFSMFVKALDDRDAVLKIKEYLRTQAPNVAGRMVGRVVIQGIEKRGTP
ncbi:conserved hypothetical protein [Nitrospina gracilis 3/211]|uniref:Uncharacterized protein n=1 Tax=Nitrospina gracilis (strain 3/211) TaxID=1266370 RepID=M1YV48_NITG3|nr:conserved hypothetical protein [Nitrospina gracilis 3/211]